MKSHAYYINGQTLANNNSSVSFVHPESMMKSNTIVALIRRHFTARFKAQPALKIPDVPRALCIKSNKPLIIVVCRKTRGDKLLST